jgi:mannose-6-phosphate isomerase-like protein (cupin superfamily)
MIKKENRIRHENSKKCIAYEYPIGDKDLNIALVEIRGRYPDSGVVINEVVKELIFVIEGKGKIVIDNKEYQLNEEDSLIILPKQKYYWEGNLKLLITCNPSWYPEQHKHID